MVDTCATERKEKLKYQKLGSVFLLGCVVVQLLCGSDGYFWFK